MCVAGEEHARVQQDVPSSRVNIGGARGGGMHAYLSPVYTGVGAPLTVPKKCGAKNIGLRGGLSFFANSARSFFLRLHLSNTVPEDPAQALDQVEFCDRKREG